MLLAAIVPAMAAERSLVLSFQPAPRQSCEAHIDTSGAWGLSSPTGALATGCGMGLWTKQSFIHQAQADDTVQRKVSERAYEQRGILSGGGLRATYSQVTQCLPMGIIFRHVFSGEDLSAAASFGILVRLPVAMYQNTEITAAGIGSRRLPKKPPRQHKLLSGRATSVIVRPPDRSPILIERQRAGKLIVQDGRKWGDQSYQVLFLLEPDASIGAHLYTEALYVGLDGKGISPAIVNFRQSRDVVPRFGLHEISLDLWTKNGNPYDPEEVSVVARFTSPSGRIAEIQGFRYQHFTRRRDDDREALTPEGAPFWKIRFTPQETGPYRYRVHVADRSGESGNHTGTFTCIGSDAPGFVSVSKKDKRYFQFTNGKTYFIIGHNLCWASQSGRTYDYDTYFSRMSQNRENYCRIWMCSWDMQLDGRSPDSYRLDNAWRLDHVLRTAENRDIYLKLCIDNFLDYTDSSKRRFIPYWQENGGPCKTPLDFFTNAEAKAMYRRRIRYILARWGYSPNIFAWELWNEMDYVVRDKPAVLQGWTEEMSRELKRLDPYKHCVTNSLGLNSVWDDMWQSDAMDFAQIHSYIHRPAWIDDEHELDSASLVLDRSKRMSHFGKPWMLSEFGYLGTNDFNQLNDADKLGIHLHNAIWASALCGAAGTAQPWWWDNYLHPNNLYYHYRALAAFLDGVDMASERWSYAVGKGGEKVRVIGLKNRARGLFWIQHLDSTWYKRYIEERPSPTLRNVRLDIPNLENGDYRIEWWDTYSGRIVTHLSARVARNRLTIKVPEIGPDIACRIEKAKRAR